MGALTEIYVDPSIGTDTGAGTVGDPYGNLQHALDTATYDSTNGNRFNIKAGASDVLSATLDFTTFGSSFSGTAPVVFEGYTSAAGDGGIGDISGGGGNFTIFSGLAYTHWLGLKLHNTGTAAVITLNGHGTSVVDCEITNASGYGMSIGNCLGGVFLNNNIHSVGARGIDCTNANGSPLISRNYIKESGATAMSFGIVGNRGATISENIVSLSSAGAAGITTNTQYAQNIVGNSVYNSAAGTSYGIKVTSIVSTSVYNNVIEGFSGTGGIGIEESSENVVVLGHNSIYNCTTSVDSGFVTASDIGGNETLSQSPFAKSGADTFANRFTYFAPVPTGNVSDGFPSGSNVYRGAVQPSSFTPRVAFIS